MTSTIPLAKSLDLSKMHFPVFLSEKHDGVPVRIDTCLVDGQLNYAVRSRSGEPVPSVADLVERFISALAVMGVSFETPKTFVAEVTHRTYLDFKNVSGVVRRQEPQENLILNFFDFVLQDEQDAPFSTRTRQLRSILENIADPNDEFRYVQQHKVRTADLAMQVYQDFMSLAPDAEGMIARSFDAGWKPNSRHWDYQKLIVDPVLDLRIVGFEEAKSATKEPLGMVGRLVAEYKGGRIGVGPGKLTHEDRRIMWKLRETYFDHGACIAAVKHKRDPSYAALRQPTFQHWRTDKSEPNEE